MFLWRPMGPPGPNSPTWALTHLLYCQAPLSNPRPPGASEPLPGTRVCPNPSLKGETLL